MVTYKKWSEYDPAGTMTGDEEILVVQSLESVLSTARAIANTANALGDHTSGTITPATDDADALGSASLRWSDLYLANGGVISFNNSYTITHSTGLLTFSGGLGGTPDLRTGAGAISLTTLTTRLVTTGANALTLADGTSGQIKIISMDTDGGDGTLTPTNFGNGTTITFNDVGDAVILQFLDGEWWLLSNVGCTIA